MSPLMVAKSMQEHLSGARLAQRSELIRVLGGSEVGDTDFVIKSAERLLTGGKCELSPISIEARLSLGDVMGQLVSMRPEEFLILRVHVLEDDPSTVGTRLGISDVSIVESPQFVPRMPDIDGTTVNLRLVFLWLQNDQKYLFVETDCGQLTLPSASLSVHADRISDAAARNKLIVDIWDSIVTSDVIGETASRRRVVYAERGPAGDSHLSRGASAAAASCTDSPADSSAAPTSATSHAAAHDAAATWGPEPRRELMPLTRIEVPATDCHHVVFWDAGGSIVKPFVEAVAGTNSDQPILVACLDSFLEDKEGTALGTIDPSSCFGPSTLFLSESEAKGSKSPTLFTLSILEYAEALRQSVFCSTKIPNSMRSSTDPRCVSNPNSDDAEMVVRNFERLWPAHGQTYSSVIRQLNDFKWEVFQGSARSTKAAVAVSNDRVREYLPPGSFIEGFILSCAKLEMPQPLIRVVTIMPDKARPGRPLGKYTSLPPNFTWQLPSLLSGCLRYPRK